MANRKGKIKLKNGDVLYPETSWDKVTGRPSSLPADGGNADTVSGHTVKSDVPANAKFTDTTYSAGTGISINSSNAISNGGVRSVTQDASDGHKLTINTGGTNTTITIPDNNTQYSAGSGLSLSGTTFNHSNSVTAVTAAGLYKVKYDAQGHITGTTAVAKKDITDLGIPSSDTNTTYTIATGDSNGQIKVTPSSGSAYNVSVKGLGSAAYTASTAYASSSHTHDDRYYTETEVDTKLAGKSNTGHNHDTAYLKLTGGTITGPLKATSNDDTPVQIEYDDDDAYAIKITDISLSNKPSVGLYITGQSNSNDVKDIMIPWKNGTLAMAGDSQPANGGNSATVNNHTVNSDVPANAKFTDTTYSAVSKTAAGLCPALPNETATTKYLRQDGTWQVPPNTTYSNATTSAAGLMSSADKTKLNGIAEGANNYTHPTSHPATMITGLATVATSGKYSDLSGKPTIPAADDHKVLVGDASKDTIYKLAYIENNASGNDYIYKELSSGLYVMTDPSDATSYAGLKFCCKGSIEASAINIDGSAVATQDWVTDRGYITGITKAMVTSALGYTPPTTDTNTWKANSSSSEGYVASGAGKANKVWKTDANGNPAWRDDANTTYSNATTSAAGLMSSTDKSKLDGIASGANNYTHPASHPASMITGLATVATSGSYNDLSNKPTIPTVPGYGTSAAKIGTSSAGSATTVSRSDHVHAIDLATGDSNGQVKIAGTNVSVKGLGSAAYTASTAYASSSHTHSNADLTGIADWAKAAAKPGYTWDEITGKPTSFTPSSHTHTKSQITDFPTSLPANGGTSTDTNNVVIADVRGATRAPNYFNDKSMKVWFNNSGTPTSDWYSGIHVKGWTKADYYAWELASGSTTSTDASNKGRLWYRTGAGSSWGDWKKVAWTSDLPGSVSKTAAGLCPALPNETATTKYLRQDGTWQVPPNTTYSVATTSANGLMSSSDKTKLDGIASGANNYSLPTATASVLGGVKSSTTGTTSGKDYNVQINADGTMKVNVPWTDSNTWKANSSSSEGYVSSGSGQANKVWKTDANGNPAWRDDANSWRGIQNNLTSDSTTDSLSAAQGKALKGMVDGKLSLSGGFMGGDIGMSKYSIHGIGSAKFAGYGGADETSYIQLVTDSEGDKMRLHMLKHTDNVTDSNALATIGDIPDVSGYATQTWVNNKGYGTGTVKKVNNTSPDANGNVSLTIPAAANNGKITINQGGVKKGEFTVNQSGNTTINLDAGGGSGREPTHLIHTSWIGTPIYKGSSRTACNTTAYTGAGVYRFYESISDEYPMLDININAYNTPFTKNMWHSLPISKYLYDIVGALPSGIGFELIGVSITPYYASIPGSTASIQPVLYASTNRYLPKASANQNSGDDALWFAVPNNVSLSGASIKLSFVLYDAS